MNTRFITVHGRDLAVNVTIESRANATARFGKTGVNIRIPRHIPKNEKKKILREFEQWARAQVERDPGLLDRSDPAPEYGDGMMLRIGSRTFTLRISTVNRLSGTGHVAQGNIILELPADLSESERNKMSDSLISRCLANEFSSEVERRVRALNASHFGNRINSIKLKNIKSRWGSCSQAGNINLSTRLLCAPPDVMDYVIVHELAHVGMMNHSAAFWNRVRRAMPDCDEKIAWLKSNGASCGFEQQVCGQAAPLQAACSRTDAPLPTPAAARPDAPPPTPAARPDSDSKKPDNNQLSISFDF